MKLISTKDYLLLINEEAEIKEGNLVYKSKSDKKIINIDSFGLHLHKRQISGDGYLKIIAYRKLNKEAKELDLPWLPNPFNPLNRRKFIYLVKNTKGGEKGNLTFEVIRFECSKEAEEWCKGKSHLEIEQQEIVFAQSKQFSLDDMKKAFESGAEMATNKCYTTNKNYGEIVLNPNTLEEETKKYIESLSIQQLPKEFIPEEKSIEDIEKDLEIYGHDEGLSEQEYQNYIKSNSLLKTIKNPKGKRELVGKYIYHE